MKVSKVILGGLLILGVAPLAVQAKTRSIETHSCVFIHPGATKFCTAVEQRKAIKIVRHLEKVNVRRAHVEFHRAHKLGWKIDRLKRANKWERSRLKELRALPSYVYVKMPVQWTCIHEHEGAWNDNTGNGYYGGLQMDWGFMRTYGADMLRKYHGQGAEAWTPHEQMIVAERAYFSGRGFHPWPSTARACGYI